MIARLRVPGGPRIQLAAENAPEPGVCSDCRERSDSVVPMRFVRTSASLENAGQSVCVVALCPPPSSGAPGVADSHLRADGRRGGEG